MIQARRNTSGSSVLNGTCVAAKGDSMAVQVSAKIEYNGQKPMATNKIIEIHKMGQAVNDM